MKTLYAQLADVQAQRKALEEKESGIKTLILEEMVQEGVYTLTNECGKFTVSSRLSYTYTEAVTKLAEKLKIAKIKEEEKGVAKAKTTTYLTFTSPKID